MTMLFCAFSGSGQQLVEVSNELSADSSTENSRIHVCRPGTSEDSSCQGVRFVSTRQAMPAGREAVRNARWAQPLPSASLQRFKLSLKASHAAILLWSLFCNYHMTKSCKSRSIPNEVCVCVCRGLRWCECVETANDHRQVESS